MTAIVRQATPDDIDPLYSLGTAEPAFGVSPRIRFYEREELAEWIAAPEGNVLLVVDDGGEIGGFCFCKLMSSHWAYLDNFYICPRSRGHGHGRFLIQALLDLLQKKKIAYLSTLTVTSDTFLAGYFRAHGLTPGKTYLWLERSVE